MAAGCRPPPFLYFFPLPLPLPLVTSAPPDCLLRNIRTRGPTPSGSAKRSNPDQDQAVTSFIPRTTRDAPPLDKGANSRTNGGGWDAPFLCAFRPFAGAPLRLGEIIRGVEANRVCAENFVSANARWKFGNSEYVFKMKNNIACR